VIDTHTDYAVGTCSRHDYSVICSACEPATHRVARC
jgi:hypothetical protein